MQWLSSNDYLCYKCNVNVINRGGTISQRCQFVQGWTLSFCSQWPRGASRFGKLLARLADKIITYWTKACDIPTISNLNTSQHTCCHRKPTSLLKKLNCYHCIVLFRVSYWYTQSYNDVIKIIKSKRAITMIMIQITDMCRRRVSRMIPTSHRCVVQAQATILAQENHLKATIGNQFTITLT